MFITFLIDVLIDVLVANFLVVLESIVKKNVYFRNRIEERKEKDEKNLKKETRMMVIKKSDEFKGEVIDNIWEDTEDNWKRNEIEDGRKEETWSEILTILPAHGWVRVSCGSEMEYFVIISLWRLFQEMIDSLVNF